MRYAMIRNMDVCNGDGIGVSLYFQGCAFRCKGCFNTNTWDFNGGKEFDKATQDRFISLCKNENIDHVSLLGGEPLQQDILELSIFISRIKNETAKPIWLWTGNNFDEIPEICKTKILPLVDMLVTGRFIEEKKDLKLTHRGSSNQRIYVKNEKGEWIDKSTY